MKISKRLMSILCLLSFSVPLLVLTSCQRLYYRLGTEDIEWIDSEKEFIDEFFMGMVDLDKVKLHQAGWDEYEGNSFEVGNDIYFSNDFIYVQNPLAHRSTLVHEILHVLQYQAYGFYSFPRSDYYYSLTPEKHLKEYGIEEQAQIIQDYYRWTNMDNMQFCLYALGCEEIGLEMTKEIATRRYTEILDYTKD